MELESLLHYLLPKELFDYFDFKGIKEEDNNCLKLHIDEKAIAPPEHLGKDLVSNGFDEPIHIQDFPLRNKAVYLVIRRRKWKDKQTGKIYSKSWNLSANGTSYTKEFADFLKGLFGQLPNQQQ